MRKSDLGNSIYLKIRCLYDETEDSTHIASNDVAGFTNVRADTKLKRGYPNLVEKLARILRDNGSPAPEEGQSNE